MLDNCNVLRLVNTVLTTLIIFRIILEADPNAVCNRVSFRSDDIPLGEQTVAQVSAKYNFIFYWMNISYTNISKFQ